MLFRRAASTEEKPWEKVEPFPYPEQLVVLGSIPDGVPESFIGFSAKKPATAPGVLKTPRLSDAQIGTWRHRQSSRLPKQERKPFEKKLERQQQYIESNRSMMKQDSLRVTAAVLATVYAIVYFGLAQKTITVRTSSHTEGLLDCVSAPSSARCNTPPVRPVSGFDLGN